MKKQTDIQWLNTNYDIISDLSIETFKLEILEIIDIHKKKSVQPADDLLLVGLDLASASISRVVEILDSLSKKTQSERKNFVSIYVPQLKKEIEIIYNSLDINN